jgi:hypothetical protein
MKKNLFDLKPLQLRRLAFEFVVRNNILHPTKDDMAGKVWHQKFIKEHPRLNLRAPERTSQCIEGKQLS